MQKAQCCFSITQHFRTALPPNKGQSALAPVTVIHSHGQTNCQVSLQLKHQPLHHTDCHASQGKAASPCIRTHVAECIIEKRAVRDNNRESCHACRGLLELSVKHPLGCPLLIWPQLRQQLPGLLTNLRLIASGLHQGIDCCSIKLLLMRINWRAFQAVNAAHRVTFLHDECATSRQALLYAMG